MGEVCVYVCVCVCCVCALLYSALQQLSVIQKQKKRETTTKLQHDCSSYFLSFSF